MASRRGRGRGRAPHKTPHARAVHRGSSGGPKQPVMRASLTGLIPVGQRAAPWSGASTFWGHPSGGSFGPYGMGPIIGW